jgi:hypothetical protein
MPLTEQYKSDIRRYLGYPVVGLYNQSPAGGSLANLNSGYRYFEAYGQLEYRMNQMKPDEEARVTGQIYGAIGFANSNIPIIAGTVITVSLTSSVFSPATQTLTYTVLDTDTLLTIVSAFANLAALNTQFAAAGGQAVNEYGVGPWSNTIVPIPITSFILPAAFTLTVSGAGNTVPQVFTQGQQLPPFLNITTTLPPTTIYGYLPILNQLESDLLGSTNNLSVSVAREATLRSTELREREWLFDTWRLKLSQFLGITLNPNDWSKYITPRSVRRMI